MKSNPIAISSALLLVVHSTLFIDPNIFLVSSKSTRSICFGLYPNNLNLNWCIDMWSEL